jgi:hypothetical protein
LAALLVQLSGLLPELRAHLIGGHAFRGLSLARQRDLGVACPRDLSQLRTQGDYKERARSSSAAWSAAVRAVRAMRAVRASPCASPCATTRRKISSAAL